jgi:hypothetical protein
MGTPDGMGYLALFCILAPIAALLIFWLCRAVGSLRKGDRRAALRCGIAFAALSALIAACGIVFLQLS